MPAIISSEARSFLVTINIIRGIFSSLRISRCSIVCCLIDSVAATTSNARSIAKTPFNILSTRSSCPGTSIIPTGSFVFVLLTAASSALAADLKLPEP